MPFLNYLRSESTSPAQLQPHGRRVMRIARRFLRFGLRTLFLVVLAVACLAFVVAQIREQNARRDRAIATVESAGGGVVFEYESPLRNPLPRRPYPLVEFVFGRNAFAQVDVIGFLNPNYALSDDQLRELDLEALRDTRMILLNNAAVTDDGIAELSRMEGLEFVELEGLDITDSGIRHLHSLRKLRHVNLKRTNVTDEGVIHVVEHTNLKYLDVSETQVSRSTISVLRDKMRGAIVSK